MTKREAHLHRDMLDRAVHTGRWTASRKISAVMLVAEGWLSQADLLRVYHVTAAELSEWRASFAAHGVDGLKASKRFR